MILLIDNYDSFSYNLYQLFAGLGEDVKVIRNDALTPAQVRLLAPEAIVLSPGPGKPADAGICEDVVRTLSGEIPILGVCLGHQAICEALGGTITYAPEIMHGKTSVVDVDVTCPIFQGLGPKQEVGRYHSLIADPDRLPDELVVTAKCATGEIMAVGHKEHPTYGLQFHPESILTREGQTMARNFVSAAKAFMQSNS